MKKISHLSLFAVLALFVFAGFRYSNPMGYTDISDSLNSSGQPVPSATESTDGVQNVENHLQPVNDPNAVYPVEVDPKTVPSTTVDDGVVHEVGSHTPPGGEQKLDELKSKELPYDPNDSSVVRVAPSK